MKNTLKGGLIAASVAGLFACGQKAQDPPADKPAADAKVHCAGINTCKGQSKCHMPDGSSSCAGQNTCKGKGWIEASEKECKEKGGTVLADKSGK
jgi:predicted small lipoprotein YifL